MARFLYCVNGVSGAPRVEELAAWGLGYAFPKGAEVSSVPVSGGACGAGVLVVQGPAQHFKDWETRYRFVKMQHGQPTARLPVAQAGLPRSIWLGVPVNAAERPGPGELLRPKTAVDGYPVRLCDGQLWQVPTVRMALGGTKLPGVITLDESGAAKLEPREEFRPLLRLCEKLWESSVAPTAYDIETILLLASYALAVNYRVGRHEVAALELVDTQNIVEIAGAVLDGPALATLMSELKKKQEMFQPGPDSAAGAVA